MLFKLELDGSYILALILTQYGTQTR